MSADFIEVYSEATGLKQMVPPHYLDNPVLSAGLKPTAAGREQQRLNTGPTLDWLLSDLEDHADNAGVDRTGLRSKTEVLDAINTAVLAPTSSPETGSTGPGGVTPDADENTTDPANPA